MDDIVMAYIPCGSDKDKLRARCVSQIKEKQKKLLTLTDPVKVVKLNEDIRNLQETIDRIDAFKQNKIGKSYINYMSSSLER